MSPELRCDVVVIGAGTAGLVAGARLAEAGASVCVLAKGIGCTHLAPGTIDVAGYTPELTDSPLEGVAALIAARADHPYGLIGPETMADAISWLQHAAENGPFSGYRYVGDLEHNTLLPTALGALRPSALLPSTMAAGDAGNLRQVCVIGTPQLRDVHPGLCAANLAAAGIEARGLNVELQLDRADASTLGIARLFDDEHWRAQFCASVSPLLHAEEHVGLPAILGIRDPQAVVDDLQQRFGRAVFEIPGLPPSVPGMRLYEILRHALRQAGGRLVLGAEVVGHKHAGDRISSVVTRAAGHDRDYCAEWFVLAAGGFASGAIELDSRWIMHERVLGLPLTGVPAPGEPRFVPGYSDEQPISRVGVAIDAKLRALGCANVVVAGAGLPGAVPWREGSGEGLALGSAVRAAQLISGDRRPRLVKS